MGIGIIQSLQKPEIFDYVILLQTLTRRLLLWTETPEKTAVLEVKAEPDSPRSSMSICTSAL